jgi:hypothetical protein
MSTIGVTDWYTSHLRTQGSAPAQHELVINYPLEFVHETVRKLGPGFYFFVETPVGSMLPLMTEYSEPESLASFKEGNSQPHPSVVTWEIYLDGSVHIKSAAIIASDKRASEIDGMVFINNAGPFEEHPSLNDYLKPSKTAPRKFAISLHQCQASQLGLLLEGSGSIHEGTLELVKVGTFLTGSTWCVPSLAVKRSWIGVYYSTLR